MRTPAAPACRALTSRCATRGRARPTGDRQRTDRTPRARRDRQHRGGTTAGAVARYGLSRASRTLELDVAGSRYQLRVRGLLPKRLCLERAEGTTVARYAIRWSTKDQLAADVTPGEVALTLLLWQLGDELAARF